MYARTTAAIAAVALLSSACSSPAQEAPPADVQEEIVDDFAGADSGEPEPQYLELDSAGDNSAEITPGLVVLLNAFERTQDASGEPALAFDITISNDTGQTFDPAGLNFWVTQGAEGAEADDAVLEVDESGAGSSAEFGSPIPDGQSATLTHGYSVDPDQEQVSIRIQPWGVEGAPEVFFTGTVAP